MKSIVIDATHYSTSTPTGVERYVDALLPLLTTSLLEKGVAVSWVGYSAEAPKAMPAGVHWLHQPYHRGWSQLVLPRLLKAVQPDLFFTPSGIPPLAYHGKTACTVHDMAAYTAPDAFRPADLLRLTTESRLAVRRASVVLTPSAYTQSEVHKRWRIPLERLHVVSHGYLSLSEAQEAVQGLLADPMLLYVGRLEEKKNLEPVVQGFAKLIESGVQAQLVLVGTPGAGWKRTQKTISNLVPAVRQRVILPGYVSDAGKSWLYHHAAAAIVPCPLEGFGFPVLDAFQANAVAICAQAGALTEVAADAALYAQPFSPTDWMLQCTSALSNGPEIQAKRQRGHEYLKRFNWNQTARLTAEALLHQL